MKVLSHPGQGISQRCIVDNWTWFSTLKTFHFSSRLLGSLGKVETSYRILILFLKKLKYDSYQDIQALIC